jgi:hypothetical protein
MSIKHINIKKMSTFDSQVSKRETIETQIEHTRLSFLDLQSSDQHFSSRGIMIGNHRNNNDNAICIIFIVFKH